MRRCSVLFFGCVLIAALSGCVEQERAAVEPLAEVVVDEPSEQPAATPSTTVEATPDPLKPPPPRPAFVVHEWGTFTSLQGSDGRALEGLHHTEEQLPEFVHRRDALARQQKALESLPEEVTQKLETPVIYFYSDEPRQVHVEVDFPEGIISEWYPGATWFAPDLGSLYQIAEGTMTWDVDLVPGPVELIEVDPQDVWAPSRAVPEATPVAFGDERERFIFYRGLGRFEVPFTVTQPDMNGLLHITNGSAQDIPAAFLLHVVDGRGAVVPLGPIAAGGTLTAQPGPKELDLDLYIEQAATQLAGALEDAGLYRDEARAMVDTWRHSYFATPGVRVLYVVPEVWTEKLLPMRLEPQPDELVRTLVGRVEVFTRAEEQALLTRVEEAAASGQTLTLEELGRFAEPRLRRVMDLSEDAAVDTWCAEHIAAMP